MKRSAAPRVPGDDPGRQPGGLVVRDPQRLLETVDERDGHGRDAFRIARPLVAERRVEGRASFSLNVEAVRARQLEQAAEQLLCAAVDESRG